MWYYKIPSSSSEKAEKVLEKEYLGTVEAIHMNTQFAAVLSEHKVQLHSIPGGEVTGPKERGIPSNFIEFHVDN